MIIQYLLIVFTLFLINLKLSEQLEILSRQSKYLETNSLFEPKIEPEELLPPIVSTLYGTLEGYHMTIANHRKIYAFEGIPFAEPPVGIYRFRAPQKLYGWNGLLQAKNPGPVCMQWDILAPKGKEDCLRLNIYTPQIPNGNVTAPNLPVIIFIHGGGFLGGSGNDYGPSYLLEENVILVTFNYRLGIFGSMTTGDEVASGNWHFKDQAMAINWVHENIENFGGNPKKITLTGQSAGAVSVHLQMMSTMANDKIASAISLSGGAYNFWGLQSLELGKIHSLMTAAISLCPVYLRSEALIRCMRKIPAELLTVNQNVVIGAILKYGAAAFPWPYVEPKVPGAFISVTPDEAYARGQVAKIPYVTTVASKDVNFYVAIPDYVGAIPFILPIGNVLLGIMFFLRGKVPFRNEIEILSKIRNYYGIKGPVRNLGIPVDFITQAANARTYVVPFHKAAQMHCQIAPTYAGLFNFSSTAGLSDQLGFAPEKYGFVHADDIRFLFNSTQYRRIGKSLRDVENSKYSKLLIKIFKNFAETGVPTFVDDDGKDYDFWVANRDPDNMTVFSISEESKLVPDPYLETARFWESLSIPDMTPYFKF